MTVEGWVATATDLAEGSPAEPSRAADQAPSTCPGAYGLRLPALQGCRELLADAPQRWTEWRIDVGAGSGAPAELLEDARARIRSAPSGWVDIDRERRSSTINLPKTPAPAEIAQPFLGSTAIVAAHWAGLHSFHAGAFVAHDGRAWAILGSRGAGKSSLLAALALTGTPILADDVVVVGEDLQGLAGPRCIDLRTETAAALGVGEPLGVVGTRERWRLRLDPVAPVAPEVPMGGWIQLEWGEPEIYGVAPEQRVRTLLANVALRAEQRDPAALSRLMELFALPMVCVRRPRKLERISETAERLGHHFAQL